MAELRPLCRARIQEKGESSAWHTVGTEEMQCMDIWYTEGTQQEMQQPYWKHSRYSINK